MLLRPASLAIDSTLRRTAGRTKKGVFFRAASASGANPFIDLPDSATLSGTLVPISGTKVGGWIARMHER